MNIAKYSVKNLVGSAIITGINCLCYGSLMIWALIHTNAQAGMVVALSLALSVGISYLILKVIALALFNTKAKRPLDTIAHCFGYLTLMCLFYPLCFGVKSFTSGWVAFGIVTLWAVLALIYESIFYTKHWRIVYAVSLVCLIICLILVMTGISINLFLAYGFIFGIFAYWCQRYMPKTLWIACLLEFLAFSFWIIGLLQY